MLLDLEVLWSSGWLVLGPGSTPVAVRILTGKKFNHISRARSVTMNPVANPLLPASQLGDGHPDQATAFSVIQADSAITLDMDQMVYGDIETFPGAWVVDAGTVVADATFKDSGTQSMKVSGSTGKAHLDWEMRAGELAKFDWALAGDGGGGTIRLQLMNPLTGNYWTGSVWTSTPTDLATRGTNSFLAGSTQFAMEPYLTVLGDLTILRAIAYCTDVGKNGWVDSMYCYPATDWLSIHGHNVEPQIAVSLRSSTDNFAANDVQEAVLTKLDKAFYAVLGAPVYKRWVRAKFAGTPVLAPPWLGEGVFGQTLALTKSPNYPIKTARRWPQARNVTDVGGNQVQNLGDRLEAITLPFSHRTLAEYQEFRDLVITRSAGGLNPIVIATPDSDVEVCIFGRLEAEWDHQLQMVNFRQAKPIVIVSEPLGAVTA